MIEMDDFVEISDDSQINIENDPNEVFVLNVFDGEGHLLINRAASTFDKAMDLMEVIAEDDTREQIEAITIQKLKLDTLNQHETLH
tara:strand:- start:148 stop:405 length:258 start_codon:yes stop_codon:yes gene_type:complete